MSDLYNYSMECQVNVAQDGGERVEGDYKGRQWHGWSDGLNVWKSFRIPYGAGTEPHYEDKSLNFNLEEHAEGIGLTGWDWEHRTSKWVAFDFDAIVGHSDKNSNKLTQEELAAVQQNATAIPWVTVRRSTSGKGLHLYVFVAPVTTANHHEHAALARAILGQMSAVTGFNFNSHVDVCGGNMWIWHRKMFGTDGLELIKRGDILTEIPSNWRDHVKVTQRKRNKTLPSFIEERTQDVFEELTGQRTFVKLDEEHRKLIDFLHESGASYWWDQDHHMLVAHTYDLQQAFNELGLRGVFTTVSTGREHGSDHNCFLFPLRKGGWVVRRYTPGATESSTWDQDARGWTRCYFNIDPDLRLAARACGGLEDDKGNFVFRTGEDAERAALMLGSELNVPRQCNGREMVLRQHKDGRRLIAEVERIEGDGYSEEWLPIKKGKIWQRITHANRSDPFEADVGNYDDLVRHLVTNEDDYGWSIKSRDTWHDEPLMHVRAALESMGLQSADVKNIIGTCVVKPWKIVNKPFRPEYPGDRCWNRAAAQFAYTPNTDTDTLTYPTWLSILEHVGGSLTSTITDNNWCKANSLRTGADYLKCWIASLFQEPTEPLPYLFLYGPQSSGKSIFHEALELLVTGGYRRADLALTNQSGFNGELENAVLCVVEETDLRKNKSAYNRIKDWVTARKINIRHMYKTPYLVENTTHWIQCSNERESCPVFSGDTRITMCYVKELEAITAKRDLITKLRKEAPDFLAEILRLELPQSSDRLNIPVINTDDKFNASQANASLLELFIEDCCYEIPGQMTPISEFYDKFHSWLEPTDRMDWTKIKIGRAMPSRFPKGRSTRNAQWHYGNLSFDPDAKIGPRLITRNNNLVEEI